MDKKNILVLSDWYLPAYKAGGPVKSLAALCHHLKNDFNFYILTTNKDAFSKTPLPVKTDEWIAAANGEKVYYLSDEKISLPKLADIIKSVEYDLIYLNSFFSKYFSIYPLLLKKQGKIKKPVVLAPRGMLGEGALSLKSKKKNLFINLSRLSGIHKNITWHATSQQEEEEIKKIFGSTATIHLASNLILPPTKQRTNYTKKPGELNLCFISRISKKKNLLFALEVLKSVTSGKIIFDIYGPAEDFSYNQDCLQFSKHLPKNITTHFKGDIEPQEVEDVLKQNHLFFLPTLNENFGHAIVEAMLNGCIPLLSDQTPWKNLKRSGFGWDLPLADKSGFIAAVNEAVLMDENTFKTQSIKIQRFAAETSTHPTHIEAYRQLFK
ncbi:MAG TPA: glycosyltransferase family 4 protein [Bacteroidia bacterium]|nr:glycosyltransferase family 4 protein [Bacteroidia bacterium]